MDPTTTLTELRGLLLPSRRGVTIRELDAQRFVELFQQLDDHLSKGGVLPEQWHLNNEWFETGSNDDTDKPLTDDERRSRNARNRVAR